LVNGAGIPTVGREGAVYGQSGGYLFFAGGRNTLTPSTANFTAFTDIYTYDTGKPLLCEWHVGCLWLWVQLLGVEGVFIERNCGRESESVLPAHKKFKYKYK